MIRYYIAYLVPFVVILLSIPLVMGKVPPNSVYGFRTPKTLSSREIWYPANTASGWLMIAAGCLTMVLNSILLVVGADWQERTLFRWLTAATLAPLLLGLAASFVYLRRLT